MRLSLILIFLLPIILTAQNSIEGKITDTVSGEPMFFAIVRLLQDGSIIKGAETDLDGNYHFTNVIPGKYDIEAIYVGYIPEIALNFFVRKDQSNRLDISIKEGVLDFSDVTLIQHKPPLIGFDDTSTGSIITFEDILKMPIPK